MKWNELDGSGACLALHQAVNDPRFEIIVVTPDGNFLRQNKKLVRGLLENEEMYAMAVHADVNNAQVVLFDHTLTKAHASAPKYVHAADYVAEVGHMAPLPLLNKVVGQIKVAHYENVFDKQPVPQSVALASRRLGIEYIEAFQRLLPHRPSEKPKVSGLHYLRHQRAKNEVA